MESKKMIKEILGTEYKLGKLNRVYRRDYFGNWVSSTMSSDEFNNAWFDSREGYWRLSDADNRKRQNEGRIFGPRDFGR